MLGGIALLSLMDALMKGASLAIGAYSTLVMRSVFGLALAAPLWLSARTGWPAAATVRLHVLRGLVVTGMSFTFFWGLTRLPLAEAIAISFTAPLVALYLAAIMLGERIGKGAVAASAMGLVGVVLIAAARLERRCHARQRLGHRRGAGVVAALRLNLVLQRKQALLARPAEVSTFHQAVVLLSLAPRSRRGSCTRRAAPKRCWSAGAAVLSVSRRDDLRLGLCPRRDAECWRRSNTRGSCGPALFGWLFFREPVTLPTLAGAALIVVACWIAAPRKRPEQSAA